MNTHTPHNSPATPRRPRLRNGRRQGGFTLIEAALTTVIVGTGVLAIVAAQQAYHMKNGWAQKASMGLMLCNEIRELTMNLPLHDPFVGDSHLGPETGENSVADYDDLDDFAGTITAGYADNNGRVFDPPIDAMRQQIDDLEGWSQHVLIEAVQADNISSTLTLPLNTADTVMRVSVWATYQRPDDDEPMEISRLVWIVTQ